MWGKQRVYVKMVWFMEGKEVVKCKWSVVVWHATLVGLFGVREASALLLFYGAETNIKNGFEPENGKLSYWAQVVYVT